MARAKKPESDLVDYSGECEEFVEDYTSGETAESLFGSEFLSDDVEPKTEKPKKKAPSKREKSTTTKGHYVTNAVLLPEVIRAKELGRMTNELARMLMLIAERYSKKANFAGYSFREDMVSYALINLMANGLKFNPEKSNNPFSFYTTAIHRSFLQYLGEERKHRDIRDELIIEEGYNPSSTFTENSKEDTGEY